MTLKQADACAARRWTQHMLRGEFEEAWLESDSITRRGRPDPHRFWDGKPLAGRRVLIRCLHGLGDTLQFIRYAPLLGREARSVTIEAQPTLKRLLAASSLAHHVITWGEPEGPWDAQIEVIELPRIFRTDLASIPQNVPYLQESVTVPSVPLCDGLRVGLLWRASSYNPARSVPVEEIARLFEVSGVRFFNLQAGPEKLELPRSTEAVPILHDDAEDALDTARKLMQLDLVITVDTMMAHLAGALGLPVWTLLPDECDWRWMLDRDDSPWYPAMRLFRQRTPGDWPSVVARVRCALKEAVIDSFSRCRQTPAMDTRALLANPDHSNTNPDHSNKS